MTTVQDCLQEVIAQGPGYIIHTSIRVGINSTTDWEPSALLADMQVESPNLLRDPARTAWRRLADGSLSCAIIPGKRSDSPGERDVLGYGVLYAYESWHKQTVTRDERGSEPFLKGFHLGA